MEPPAATTVEVIVPHRSRWDLLERLLESLQAQTREHRVCVVDNASEDETLARLQAHHPEVRVVASPQNLGFGRAINAGVRTSQADAIVLLNNDMVAEPDFLERMVEALDEDSERAVAALQLRPDGRVDTLGVAVDQSLCAYDVGHGLPAAELDREVLTAIAPSGGAAGYRRETFERFGGYDERIFAYLEDADLGLRMHAGGVRYHLARDARVVHLHSATLGSGSAAKNRLMGFSRGYLLRKYRRSLSAPAKLRGCIIDLVVLAGQAVIDRNLGALHGRRTAIREPVEVLPEMAIPATQLTLSAALRRRLARR